MSSTCIECSAPVSDRSRTGRCRPCATARMARARRFPRLNCLDCGKELALKTAIGRCNPCGNRWRWAEGYNGLREKQKAGIQRVFADPEYRAKNTKACRRTAQKNALNEDLKAQRSANWWHMYNTVLNRPDIRAKNRAAVSAKSGKALSNKRLAWCPEEMRERYRYLMRTKRMLSELAKQIIEKEWADIQAVRSGDLEGASAWLRRLSYVQRCDADGKPDPSGSHYRFGSAVLSAGEVLARAKVAGWKPFEWKTAA